MAAPEKFKSENRGKSKPVLVDTCFPTKFDFEVSGDIPRDFGG